MRKKFSTFMTKQFGQPRGLLGKFIGNRMAKGNVYDAQWTISLLNIKPADHVIEIGFGPGVSTQLAAQQASQGFVAGIDHSAAMVEAASQRNAATIQAGRMKLQVGEVSSLPYPDEAFDVAFSLHSIYFWAEPAACFQELRRVLKAGGLLGITIQPREAWAPNVDRTVMTLYLGTEIADLLSEAGYKNIHVKAPPQGDHKSLECILAVK